jgi:hypothetical protein
MSLLGTFSISMAASASRARVTRGSLARERDEADVERSTRALTTFLHPSLVDDTFRAVLSSLSLRETQWLCFIASSVRAHGKSHEPAWYAMCAASTREYPFLTLETHHKHYWDAEISPLTTAGFGSSAPSS